MLPLSVKYLPVNHVVLAKSIEDIKHITVYLFVWVAPQKHCNQEILEVKQSIMKFSIALTC